MKQKIEVHVTAAVDEQWPRLTSENPANIHGGAQNYVQQTKSQMFLFLGGFTQCIESVPAVMLPQNHYLCFDSMKAAVDWWTNPQPVKAEPEAVELWKIPANSFFIHHGELYRDTDISDGNGHCSVYHQGDGKIVEMSSETMVTPFYGTITINVGREEQ